MPREYRHIKQYEKEIFKLKEQGLSQRQIGERLGISYEKMHDFFKRHNRKQRKISAEVYEEDVRPEITADDMENFVRI